MNSEENKGTHLKGNHCWSFPRREATVKPTNAIRRLVEKAIHIRRLTPDIENAINSELTRLGYVSDADYEALELLMDEMDAGRIQLVPSLGIRPNPNQLALG